MSDHRILTKRKHSQGVGFFTGRKM